MKKLLSLVLMLATMLTMVCFMTACGDEADKKDDKTSSQSSSQADKEGNEGNVDANASVFPEALTNIPAIDVPELANTGWTLSGGMVNGVEMEEADLQAVLDACGGALDIIFLDAGKAQLANGENVYDGTFEVTEDKAALRASFTEDYSYFGVFTEVEGTPVLVLSNTKDSETALYMVQISEH